MTFSFKTSLKLAIIAVAAISTSSLAWAKGAFTLPEYDVVTLDNGIKVYLMEQHEVPMIDINVVVNSGAVFDSTLAGEAQATAQSLLLGTKKLTREQLEETFEFAGADVDAQASMEYTGISASFLAKDDSRILPILADMLQQPRFDETEFTHFKQRHIDQLKQRKESPSNVSNEYFKQLILKKHPYQSTVDGTQSSMTSMTLEHVKSFYSQHYAPQNTAIIAVGDFSKKHMLAKLKQHFGQWKNAQFNAPNMDAKLTKTPTKPKQANVLLVNKGDSRQSTFIIGGLGIPRKNPDYVSLQVLNTILGGRFTSWLNSELRVNSGLTYGARSRFSFYKHTGMFYISSYTNVDTTEKAMDLALETYARLWEKGIDETTLESAKAYVKGQFPPRYETTSQLADLLRSMHVYGFDESYIDTFQNQVDTLTVDKAKALVAKYFPKENLQTLVIGKADSIRNVVKKYGKVTEVDITEPGFAVKL